MIGSILNKLPGTIRLLIADNHPVTRIGIHSVLKEVPDIEVVGEAKDGVEVKQMIAELHPDVLLLDLIMPGLRPSGFKEWVCTNCAETITLVLTAHDQDCYLAKAIEAGVAGFLTKEKAPKRLVEAIRCAARGEVLITGEQLVRAYSWRKEVGKRWESLTEREREVLKLVADGRRSKEIAEVLCVTEKTIEKHISNVLNKLALNSRTEAVLWVVRSGMTNLLQDMVGKSLP